MSTLGHRWSKTVARMGGYKCVFSCVEVFFSSMARQPCWGCLCGCPVGSSLVLDTQPASVENNSVTEETQRLIQKKTSKKVHVSNISQTISSLFSIRWPVWEIRGSTPACRPCRWGSTWRRRTQWSIPLWCSSLGTYNQTVWGTAPSAGSSLWYTENSGDTEHFHMC